MKVRAFVNGDVVHVTANPVRKAKFKVKCDAGAAEPSTLWWKLILIDLLLKVLSDGHIFDNRYQPKSESQEDNFENLKLPWMDFQTVTTNSHLIGWVEKG